MNKLYLSNYESRLILALASLAETARENGAILLSQKWDHENIEQIEERENGYIINVPNYVNISWCGSSIHFIYNNNLFYLYVGEYHNIKICVSPLIDNEKYDSNTYGYDLYDDLKADIFNTNETWEKIKNKRPELVYKKCRKYWASWDGKKGGYTYENIHEIRKTNFSFYHLEVI